MLIANGSRSGKVEIPVSKSHLHRLLIAEALAGECDGLAAVPGDPEDIKATKRCLAELVSGKGEVVLDVGESGSTLRFLSPLVPALGKKARFIKAGRLATRPTMEYPSISPGVHELPGDVSSQFVTGLIFALPLLDGESEIRFTSPLESRGYVDMTLDVVRDYGIAVDETPKGFIVSGRQRFALPQDASKRAAEKDWSGAAFWVCANAMGNEISFDGLKSASRQPDRAVVEAVKSIGGEIDVSGFPDSFPALSVAAACHEGTTRFSGTRRLRLKESDRVAAMADVLARFGVETDVEENAFFVHGSGKPLSGGAFSSYGDHRIAMSIAIGATRAEAPVEIDDVKCAAKSYPAFFDEFSRLETAIDRKGANLIYFAAS